MHKYSISELIINVTKSSHIIIMQIQILLMFMVIHVQISSLFNSIIHSEPSESPSNVTVTAINATSVIASWVPPPPEDRNGIIQGYSIRVVGVHTDEDFSLTINATEISVGLLHPFYSYKFSVAAITISHGPFSNPFTLMMPPLGL